MIRNFTFSELTRTSVSGDNIPDNLNVIGNLVYIAQQLQRIRDRFGFAIRVNSGYRSPAVNVAVGGSATSAHMRGLAADVCAWTGKAADNAALWQLITAHLDDLAIDQAIAYTVDGKRDSAVKYIHVGWCDGAPRKQVLYR